MTKKANHDSMGSYSPPRVLSQSLLVWHALNSASLVFFILLFWQNFFKRVLLRTQCFWEQRRESHFKKTTMCLWTRPQCMSPGGNWFPHHTSVIVRVTHTRQQLTSRLVVMLQNPVGVIVQKLRFDVNTSKLFLSSENGCENTVTRTVTAVTL